MDRVISTRFIHYSMVNSHSLHLFSHLFTQKSKFFAELAERGHNVTVMSYIHVNNPHKNYNELLLTELPELNGTLTYDTMVCIDE